MQARLTPSPILLLVSLLYYRVLSPSGRDTEHGKCGGTTTSKVEVVSRKRSLARGTTYSRFPDDVTEDIELNDHRPAPFENAQAPGDGAPAPANPQTQSMPLAVISSSTTGEQPFPSLQDTVEPQPRIIQADVVRHSQ